MLATAQTSSTALNILSVSSGLGQTRAGLELGPAFLRSKGRIALFESKKFFDVGDLSPESNDLVAHWKLLRSVRQKSIEVLKGQGQLLVLGGDHSVAIGTIQAALLRAPNARVVWFDAHGDINTPDSSPSGNLHGMPLAALLGLFDHPLDDGPRLRPENLLLIGVRELDPPEREIIERLKINIVTSNEINISPARATESLSKWLSHSNEAIHLSFDIDCLDPLDAPSTGLTIANGLRLAEACSLVNLIARTGLVRSIDLVEFNPLCARSDEELGVTVDSIQQILSAVLV